MQYSIAKCLLTFSVLATLFVPYCQDKAIAQENSDISPTNFKITFDPPAEDSPRTSVGGGTRTGGQCIDQAKNSDLQFSVLQPASAMGLTVASHPTVLVYLPETSAERAFFSWRSEDNKDQYQTILPIENTSGIISLAFPDDAPPLEVGKNYQWALGIMCDGRLQPDSPMVQGHIKRVALKPSVQSQIESAGSLESAALYAEAGIWYETVATLAQLKTAQPNDRTLMTNWSELLTSVGLEKIAEAPLSTN